MWAADHQIHACEFPHNNCPGPRVHSIVDPEPVLPLRPYIPSPAVFQFSTFFLARFLGFPVPGTISPSDYSTKSWPVHAKTTIAGPPPLSAHSSVCFSPHPFPDHHQTRKFHRPLDGEFPSKTLGWGLPLVKTARDRSDLPSFLLFLSL